MAATLATGISGCGSGADPTSPTPSPSPGPFAIVANRVAGALVSLAIDPQTGSLSQASSFTIGDPSFRITSPAQIARTCALAGDPRGRFVYMAFGGHLGVYAVDKTIGSLTERPGVTVSDYIDVDLLAASERQVHGVFDIGGGSRAGREIWMAFNLDAATGVLSGPACPTGCDLRLPDHPNPSVVLPESTGRFVYSDSFAGLLFRSAVQSDGSLLDMGATQLLVDAGWYLNAASGAGLLAVTDGSGNLQTAAFDPSTGLLTPRPMASRAFTGAHYTTPEVAVGATGLLALAGQRGQGPWGLEIWRVDPTGALDRRALASLPPRAESEAPFGESNTQHLAFDPSGRFLYVSGSADGVHAFAVAADGGLRDIGTYAFGTGPIVMVAP